MCVAVFHRLVEVDCDSVSDGILFYHAVTRMHVPVSLFQGCFDAGSEFANAYSGYVIAVGIGISALLVSESLVMVDLVRRQFIRHCPFVSELRQIIIKIAYVCYNR